MPQQAFGQGRDTLESRRLNDAGSGTTATQEQARKPVDRRSQASQFSHLLDRIYEAVDDAALWPAVLGEISTALHSSLAVLAEHSDEAEVSAIAVDGAAGEVPSFDGACDRFGALASGWRVTTPLRMVQRENIQTLPGLKSSRFYEEILRPRFVFHLLYAVLDRDHRSETALLLCRSVDEHPYSSDDVALCQLLLDHLARAWRLSHQRSRTEELLQGTLAAIEQLSVGLMVLDGNDNLLVINAQAQEFLGRNPQPASPSGEIRDRNGAPYEGTALSTAERRLIGRFSRSDGSGEEMVPQVLNWKPARNAPTLKVLVRDNDRPAGSGNGGKLVFLLDPRHPPGKHIDSIVQKLYKLTRAEVRVARLIAQGSTPKEIAAKLGVSVNTVRTHLKRVFQKMRVERQVELAHLFTATFGFLRSDR